jgi:hypothetical protein
LKTRSPDTLHTQRSHDVHADPKMQYAFERGKKKKVLINEKQHNELETHKGLIKREREGAQENIHKFLTFPLNGIEACTSQNI